MVKKYDIKVVKFGGSSLSSASQIKKAAAIIRAEDCRRYVIPSAPGKRFDGDTKVTDLLLKTHALACEGKDWYGTFSIVEQRFFEIVQELGVFPGLVEEFARIRNDIANGASRDYVASRGEYLSGIVLSALLGLEFIDPKNLILFDENGKYLPEQTNELLSEKLRGVERAVIPGFYGSTADGEIKTFSRGGSDVTGSIVSRAVNADLYENWTDVSGFLMCDPRIVENPKVIKELNYRELRELSYMGATVLHEESIFPLKKAGIPINIRNTNIPSDPGTMIIPSNCVLPSHNVITGVAGKRHMAVIRIEKDMMNQEVGFAEKVLGVFSRLGMNFEHLPSGIDTVCVVIAESEIEGHEEYLLRSIIKAVEPDNIVVETGLSLVSVVGRGMLGMPGIAARVFKAVAEKNISIKLIDQGSSEMNIIIGVKDSEFKTAVRAIYNEFCL